MSINLHTIVVKGLRKRLMLTWLSAQLLIVFRSRFPAPSASTLVRDTLLVVPTMERKSTHGNNTNALSAASV